MIELKPGQDHERDDILFCLAHSASDDTWYTGSSDAGIHRLDASGAQTDQPPLLAHQSYVTGAAVAQGRLWSVGYDRLLNEWDLASGQLRSSRKAHAKWIRNIQVTPDGRMLATVGDDMIARIWDAASGQLLKELKGHAPQTPQGFSTMLYTCAFSSDGSLLATADRIGDIILWEIRTGKIMHHLKAPIMYTWDEVQRLRSIGGIRSLCFSPNQTTLAAGGMGHVKNVDGLGGKARIEWFSVENGKQAGEFESDTHKGLIEDLHYLEDGSHLISAGGSGKGFWICLDSSTQKSVSEPESSMYIHRFHLDTKNHHILAVGHHKAQSWTLANTSTS